MRQKFILGASLAGLFAGFGFPAFAADPPAAKSAAAAPAAGCLKDLQSFSTQIHAGGYWLGSAGYGYGYPIWGYADGEAALPVRPAAAANANTLSARSGYEVRVLLAAATVLAQNGEQATCAATLATARGIYTQYAARLQELSFARADNPAWQLREIAGAVPIAGSATSYRSDQLLDTDVRDGANEALGSIHDIIIDPATGRIAYLVVGRGGLFGIGENFVPVPWESFRVARNLSLLVLDTTRSVMDGAPKVRHDQFGETGQYVRTSQQVDSYWRAHPMSQPAAR